LKLGTYRHVVQGRKVTSKGNSDLAWPLRPSTFAKVDSIDRATGRIPADDIEDGFLSTALQRNESDLVRRTGGGHTRQSCGGSKLGDADPASVDMEDQVRSTQAGEGIVEGLGRSNQKG